MDSLITTIEALVNKLPPLLQLILGAAVVMVALKLMVMTADFFDKKKGEKK